MTYKEKGEEADKERKATSCKKGTTASYKKRTTDKITTSQLQKPSKGGRCSQMLNFKNHELKGQKDIHA
uniref:Putative ovule protein n=1 Tax=Solanum chacoense TaxID=4108 RepID=A0A0V0HXF0_SOLCH